MNRFVFAAIVALGLTLAGNSAARAHGCGGPYGFVPGHINLTGSIGLSWGNIGFGNLNQWGPSGGMGGYGHGCGHGHGFGHGYGYGYGHPMGMGGMGNPYVAPPHFGYPMHYGY